MIRITKFASVFNPFKSTKKSKTQKTNGKLQISSIITLKKFNKCLGS